MAKKKLTRSKIIKKLDNIFSQYIRLSNSKNGNCTCVTCGKVGDWKNGGIQAGHFISRKHYSTRWNEDNVKPQCVGCNVFRYGEQYKFSLYLGKKKAQELFDKSLIITKFASYELEDMIDHYSDEVKKLLL
jgi:5-methylcytosine-specific restriction endonuclease McrA